jgi:hypothetical protein
MDEETVPGMGGYSVFGLRKRVILGRGVVSPCPTLATTTMRHGDAVMTSSRYY